MALPQLTVFRHDQGLRALITLAGALDLGTAPLVREVLAGCLHDGVLAIDIDLTPLTFCDCSGLNVFLEASLNMAVVGGSLHLHHPPAVVVRVVEITGSGFLLSGSNSAAVRN
jgi:anti-sigma B factor antagonist